MNTLFLNLASHSGTPGEGACIACVGEKKTEATRFIDHRIGDDRLMPELDAVLKEAGWTLCVHPSSPLGMTHSKRVMVSGDEPDTFAIDRTRPNDSIVRIGRVACVTGPGGFTSLRMAVTLANVLGDQLEVPLAGVRLDDVYEARTMSFERRASSFEETNDAIHSKLPARSSQLSFLWFHSTKRTQLFVRGFGEFVQRFPEATLMEMGELFSILKTENCKPCGERCRTMETPSFLWTGELLPAHEEEVTKAGGKRVTLQSLEEVLPTFLAGLTYERKQLEPWYGRGW